MIVLSWIAKAPSHWQTFVADIISRGCTPSQLSCCKFYWQGPSCLVADPSGWHLKPPVTFRIYPTLV